jgi:hypothetical protein
VLPFSASDCRHYDIAAPPLLFRHYCRYYAFIFHIISPIELLPIDYAISLRRLPLMPPCADTLPFSLISLTDIRFSMPHFRYAAAADAASAAEFHAAS